VKAAVLALAALLALSGCSVNVASLAIAAPVRPAPAALASATSHGWQTGQSCRFWLLGIPFGLPQVDEAMTAALAPVHGVFMRTATVYSEHPVYLLYGWHCYRVVGEVFG
jgi:uncharacterized protein YceK